MPQNPLINKRRMAGQCHMKFKYCEGYSNMLEWHHETYYPSAKIAKDRGLGLWGCHSCHNMIHFRPQYLTHANKVKLILARIGADGRVQSARGEIDVEAMANSYSPPSRE